MATIPSISLIPSGYKAGKVYSVLPTDGSGDLTFARASTATRINKNNLIENVGNNVPRLDYEDGGCPSLLLEPTSRNLITQSEAFGNAYWTKSGASIEGDASTAGAEQVVNGSFATDTDWAKGTGWAISGGTLNYSGVTSGAIAAQYLTSLSGKVYKLTFTITGASSGATLRFLNESATTFIGVDWNTYENGTHTIYGNGAGSTSFWIQGDSANSFSIDNVSVKEVSGFSAPSVDSPLGAFKLVEDTNNGQHKLQKANLTVSATSNTVSYFVKKAERNKVLVEFGGGGGGTAGFDLSLGAIISESGVTAKIELISSDWYRCSVTFTTTATSVYTSVYTLNDSNSNSYQGDGTSGVYIFGAQLEQLSYATSYIPTAGSQITRLAETANNAGNASTFNDSEGVLFAEISALANDGTNRRIAITDTSITDFVYIYFSSTNTLSVRLQAGGSQQFVYNHAIDITQNNKVAFKWKLNDVSMYVNGIEVGKSNSSNVPLLNSLNSIGFNAYGGDKFYGNTKQIQYFNTALTDSELETLVSWVSFQDMAQSQNYIIQ